MNIKTEIQVQTVDGCGEFLSNYIDIAYLQKHIFAVDYPDVRLRMYVFNFTLISIYQHWSLSQTHGKMTHIANDEWLR